MNEQLSALDTNSDNQIKILSIEDSEDDALLVLRELRQSGMQILWERVEGSEDLQAALNRQTWDVVISDYHLPHFNAPAALKVVQAHDPMLPFVVVSGTIGETAAVKLMKAGANDYVAKANLTRLPEVIRREVREAKIRLERQQAQIELNLVKERLQLAIAGSGIGLWDWEVQTGGLMVNEQWATMIGYHPAELEPINFDTWQSHVHPEDLIKATAALETHFRQEIDNYECELRMLHKSGNWIWIFCQGRVIERSESGKPLRMLGTNLNINDRKQANQALEQLNHELETRVEQRTKELQTSEERTRATLLALPDLVFRVDCQGTYLDFLASPQGLNLVDPQQVIGKRMYEVVIEGTEKEYINRKYEALHRAITTQTVQIYEHQIQLGDRIHYEEVRVSPCGNDEAVFFIRDISGRKQAEVQLQQTYQELAQATRLKDEFLANMSHELRTPLNAILGMTEGLQEQVFGTICDRQLKALQNIESSGSHLLSLINDILDVAKISAGRVELEYSSTSLQVLCKLPLTLAKQQASQKNIHIHTQIPHNLPDLNIDERRIRQVLINLLNNAVKFTPEGGHITLAITQVTHLKTEKSTQEYVRISITDTGIGISPENLTKLFQPFSQIDSALNRKYQGTGLGLALVKSLVEMHGGMVSVTSELGVGSCFSIMLPCTEISSPSAILNPSELNPNYLDPSTSSPDALISPLILLVEDNESNIITFSSYLTAKGYHLITANNGLDAIAIIQTEHPDLILMDIQMPHMDGIEAMQLIRQNPQFTDTPIIAITGLAMAGDRERCIAAGANDYLTKPVKLKELVTTIQKFLSCNK
ncbi:response regulator [Pseudanabaena mucicola]|uniref:histidine kinase n=1 Tax=Pseudanabaena mucicola FACHB-723 TaxID=2692860 RepID=A0ABR7ZUR6_9CYAN|nr:response regulator [Pseudanabaena mucicola]MBD2187021.1 response regulator [Pseudanabaena mucicola FACHB-723]